MSIRELIEKLAENRVDVWLDGNKLRYRAPKQALSPELMGELKAGKEALIAYLREQQQQPFPLTYGQRALWFLHKTAPDSPAYNVAFSAVIASRLDSAVMNQALAYLHERHAALRLRFADHAGEPLQYFSSDSAVDYQVIDASAWDDERLGVEVDNSYQAPFSLDETQALFRVRIFSRGSDSHLMLIVFHPIIGDGWSL
ncbi:MAG: condensation domain-containing protein, partial [Burkholderiales bacterium]|nr:condensation domain-containing protein [Burkholderiales bacterium]